jgi:D-alanyl-lipoteichoic acid acyltransferase DltB (MBOAT superfamily)
MLFNSYEFLFLFLPVTFLVFFAIARLGREIAIAWLVTASLFFYGWWNPAYLILILLSMVVNFGFGEFLSKAHRHGQIVRGKFYLALGLMLNLSILGYFKYAGFLIGNLNTITGTNIDLGHIVLPLAISFFTFQQIAYLVDAYKGITQEYRFSHYALFVTFFPQLIAGPIVHHKEMLPQFMRQNTLTPQLENVAIGLSIFFFGLFKKAVLADGVANYSTPCSMQQRQGKRSPSLLLGEERWPIRCSFTLISLAILTWQLAVRDCSASACHSIFIRPTKRPVS